MSEIQVSKFSLGQIVQDRLFGYRGVIFDVDPCFRGKRGALDTQVAEVSTGDMPWYHLLVDNTVVNTYVAETNLELDKSGSPVLHPLLSEIFSEFKGGKYVRRGLPN